MNSRISLRVLFFFTFLAAVFTSRAQQVTASFSATPISGCAPLITRFTDQSTGNPTSWKWDLGNGTISFLQNPSVLYFTPGKYKIKLIAKNANSEDSVVKINYIEVFANPVVAFSVSDTTGCYPLPVQFTDATSTTTGSITSWLWDFGDGSTSTLQHPPHTYIAARNFSVTLQVKNSNGCISNLIKPSMIQINKGAMAEFTNDNPHTCTAPVTINFQNQSTGTGAIEYLWNFGDGTTSTLLNPSHHYTTQGTYSVRLSVINNTGCADTVSVANAVTVGSVRAGFTVRDTACQNTGIQFSNTSAPAPARVKWTFGDGTFSTALNPIKTYTTAGTFTVKMAANFGACDDSLTKVITILPRPTSYFSADDTGSCKAPFTVNFTNQSTNVISYAWTFGDGTTSTLANPSHTYTTFGSYTVSLTVTNSNGCTHISTKSNYIIVQQPIATFSNLPDSGCVSFTKTFTLTTTSSDPVVGYLWNFGDGHTSSVAEPVNTYTTEGAYAVSVIITTANGCKDTATISRGIVASNKPTANFTAGPLETCAKNPVLFTDQSVGGPTRWLWDFGDSTTSNLKNPNHKYLDTGYFDIKLTIWKGGCSDSITFPRYLHINPPVAKFTVSLDCKKPFERKFNDFSIGADEWLWDFGDGTTSNIPSPVHTYSTTGFYTVSLRVVNNTYGCDYTMSSQIRILDENAYFTTLDTNICKGSNVTLTTGLSLSNIRSFSWSFGDGSPLVVSTLATTASHIYPQSGAYTVRLITLDRNNCRDTLTRNTYINVTGPTAKFAPSVGGACLNSTILFNDSSIATPGFPITQWNWNYGDGSTEVLTASPFQHVYSTAGTFMVKLKVIDTKGCKDSFSLKPGLIISRPKADFTSVDTFSCPGKPVRFVNQSTGSNLTYRWSFGDNTFSTIQTPSHSYGSDGSYSVKLVVTDPYGCMDSIVKTNYINILSPMANFIMSDSTGNCPPLIVDFTDLSGNASSKKWDFGDSTYSTENNPVHFYNYPGTYFAKLTVSGPGGCTSVFQRKIVIKGPEGSFTYNPRGGCNPLQTNFIATTNGRNSFVWDFNDGNIVSGPDSLVSHSYTYVGKYVPKMILIDQSGCQVPIRGKDTIFVSGIKTQFSFNRTLLCDSGLVSFTDSSIINNDVIGSYGWSFGDGTFSTNRNPVHSYNTTGYYYPSLIATSAKGCTDTLRSAIPVKIVTSPKINILSTANGCVPLNMTFNSQLLAPDTSAVTWKWNFANGNTAAIASPVLQQFTASGIYNVKLVGTNSSGCKDSVTKNIEAYAIPLVSTGPDVILCKGSSLNLQATGAATYSWSPATGLSCTTCANPATTVNNNTNYIITGTSTHGCIGRDTITVTVKNKFIFQYSKNDSVCRGQSKNLSASGAYSYVWTPAGSLNDATASNTVATPDTSTVYMVVGTDEVGCFKDTGYIPVRVNPIPTIDAGADKTINVGQTIDLIPVLSADITFVNWQPTTGIFRNFYPGITVKPSENTEYVVEAKNRGGCMARDRVTVFVICNGSNIFIPNTFSPNGDGNNDIFYPRGTGLFKIKNLRIFTRWGEVIFERSNFDANNSAYGWDGTNRGSQLNPDVFVYTIDVICDNGSVLTYRGNVALVK